MPKFIFAISFFLFLAHPALAAAPETDEDATCTAASGTVTDYAQKGDDIILVECPAHPDGGVHASSTCACHQPPGDDGKCAVYACNSDGSPTETEARHAAAPVPAKKHLPVKKKPKPAPPKKSDAASPPQGTP